MNVMPLQPIVTITSSVLLSTAACWFIVASRSPLPEPTHPVTLAPDADEASLREELRALRAEVAGLVGDQQLSPVSATRLAVAPALPPELSRDAVAELIRGLVKEDALVAAADAAVGWPGGHLSATDTIRAILDGDVTGDEVAGLWEEAAANGQLHELLAAMEAEMENVPESADKHFDRARAYYSAAQAMPTNADGNWWVDSNSAYNEALENDPQHWEARYQKARNMSFWPVAYGGQAEAVKHFEMLADQQESGHVTGGSAASFPKTYVWLGNLYAQQGNTAAAKAAWERGLAAFPGDGWLLERLGTLD